jgi:uncharacterized repeat protein (TIGR03803 family)
MNLSQLSGILVTIAFALSAQAEVSSEIVHEFPRDAGFITGLVQTSDGNFYGTDLDPLWGSIFKMTPDGQVSRVAFFDYETTGDGPASGMIRGRDGNLYGTTAYGRNGTTVFRYEPGGALTTLCVLDAAQGFSYNLAQTSNGDLYGVLGEGYPGNLGVTFRVTLDGQVTYFTNLNSIIGKNPLAGLIAGDDENLYGTAMTGGSYGYGTVFKMDTNGNTTPLAEFDGFKKGAAPNGLCLGRNGILYGTLCNGGPDDAGTVVRVKRNGRLTRLVSFRRTSGNHPTGSLVCGVDGNFYGTTSLGGTSGTGTAFRMTASGKVSELFSFAPGKVPMDGTSLVQGIDRKFYGITFRNGTNGATIYRFQGMKPNAFRFWSVR